MNNNNMIFLALLLATVGCAIGAAHYQNVWLQSMSHDFQISLFTFMTHEIAATKAQSPNP